MAKILVVEDDSTIISALEFTLVDEGYNVTLADSKKAALDILENEEFDLILLDLMLPDGSGYDICKVVRATSDIPIIFLTACDEEVNVVMGLELGADDYITKPFKIRELLARIKANLRRKINTMSQDNNIIRDGDIEIDINKAIVKKNNSQIFLSATEYKLVLKLVENRGQVVSRDQILQSIWDIDGEFVNDNTLTVYMKRLREKLVSHGDEKYIKTVRGIGYMWGK